ESAENSEPEFSGTRDARQLFNARSESLRTILFEVRTPQISSWISPGSDHHERFSSRRQYEVVAWPSLGCREEELRNIRTPKRLAKGREQICVPFDSRHGPLRPHDSVEKLCRLNRPKLFVSECADFLSRFTVQMFRQGNFIRYHREGREPS